MVVAIAAIAAIAMAEREAMIPTAKGVPKASARTPTVRLPGGPAPIARARVPIARLRWSSLAEMRMIELCDTLKQA